MLTPLLCCGKCSCVSLLLILHGLGIFIFFRLRLLRSLDSVEIARRHNLRGQKRFTLRGFSFPPCLLDMVVVDVKTSGTQILILPKYMHVTSHMLIAAH